MSLTSINKYFGEVLITAYPINGSGDGVWYREDGNKLLIIIIIVLKIYVFKI